MSSSPQFASTPKVGVGALSTANANRDGTGTVATVFTAGSYGSRIEEVRSQFRVTSTTGAIRLYLYDGATYYLFDELLVLAVTVSATVSPHSASRVYDNLVLPSGWSLRASTEKAEASTIFAFGGDL